MGLERVESKCIWFRFRQGRLVSISYSSGITRRRNNTNVARVWMREGESLSERELSVNFLTTNYDSVLSITIESWNLCCVHVLEDRGGLQFVYAVACLCRRNSFAPSQLLNNPEWYRVLWSSAM